ncbi:hypothetical protein Tsubulata_039379 [Turnera subulata]|uniref:Cyclin N-terminal domain-containing protein n=1 Tax=Turnera subulata TaxID=218843 RepID=A0A9Q0F0E3_9ROSI|nr:hypothetical protein Tsubulata_039379 [Turnera subulata]
MATSISINGTATESETYSALGLDAYDKRVSGTPQVLSLLASSLETTIQKNKKSALITSRRKDAITVFHSSRSPSLSIRHYIERIFKYSRCSNSCYVVAHIYIDRFLQRMDAQLTSLNVHRLLITSIMIAAKFWDDE